MSMILTSLYEAPHNIKYVMNETERVVFCFKSDEEQPLSHGQRMDREQGWRTGGGGEMAGGMPDGSEGGERMAGVGRTASDDQQDNDIDDI